MPPKLVRTIRAQLRDIRVLFQELKRSLLVFAIIVGGGALLFRLFYVCPLTGERPSFAECLYGTFAMVFFESVLDFPDRWYLQILFFVIPVFGLAVAADGVLRFGAAVMNKQLRGQKWEVSMASTYSNHVIVCGLGKVGFRVAMELLKFGREVVAIESEEDSHFVEKARSSGIPVIIADARRSASLSQAGIERAQAIVPCTDDELANLDIALDARDVRPDIKVVMRMYDPDLARRVQKGFGIHTAFSTSALAAPIFATAATGLNVKHSFYLDETLLHVSEIRIAPQSKLKGWNVEKLEADFDLSVVLYQDGNATDMHPPGDQVLDSGDRILVLTTLPTLQELEELNGN